MSAPLAERLRPRTIDEYVRYRNTSWDGTACSASSSRRGQRPLRSSSGVRRAWARPPSRGSSPRSSNVPFFTLSAVTSGVKEVRAEVIESARKSRFFDQRPPFLFIDEIHRFNKSQQDSLLGAVEQGVVTLIGATTENPWFEVISPLLSRCQVYILRPMEDEATCKRCSTGR